MKIPRGDIVENALVWMQHAPIVSAAQIATVCAGFKHPEKRASEALRFLESQKLARRKKGAGGKGKVWALTKAGREALGLPEPQRLSSVWRTLRAGDVWGRLHFCHKGLERFEFGYRQAWRCGKAASRTLSADAFFVYKGKPFFFFARDPETEASAWTRKWREIEEYYFLGRYEEAQFQAFFKYWERPRVLVLSPYAEDALEASAEIRATAFRSAEEAEEALERTLGKGKMKEALF